MLIVLMYHSIGGKANAEVGADLYSVPIGAFRTQMTYLVELCRTSSYQVVTLAGVMNHHGHRLSTIDHRLIITFDDGDITNYTTAFPVLQEFNLPASFFILASKVGTKGYMNWEQLKELKDGGMIIGSHGMNHTILTTLDDERLDYELKESKRTLEANLGCCVDFFSIPLGFYNKKVIDKAKEAGYKAILTSRAGANRGNSSLHSLKRIAIKPDTPMDKFAWIVERSQLPVTDKIEYFSKKALQKILGNERYHRVRKTTLQV